jgi:hypothetical protein
MTTFFRFSVSSCQEVRQFLGAASYIIDIQPFHDGMEISIRDVDLDRIYFLEVSASIAAEFDN